MNPGDLPGCSVVFAWPDLAARAVFGPERLQTPRQRAPLGRRATSTGSLAKTGLPGSRVRQRASKRVGQGV